jgi:hypothetical protein
MEKEKLGLYLYCLYWREDSLPVLPPAEARAGSRTQTGFPDLVGVDGEHKVFTLYYGDVKAAISLVPLHEFGTSALEQRMGDLEWIAPRVLIHERIIEAIMAIYPVMPTRFCTIFAGGERIEELLRLHHGKITRFFSDIADKEEWGVKGYINGGQLEKAIKGLSPAVQPTAEKLKEASPGQAYLLRKKRDLALKDGLSGMAAQVTEEIFQDLLAHATKGTRNKVLQLEGDKERKEMILNAAFLVPESNVRIFRGKVKETEEKYRSRGLTLSVTGPWPPYNFCPVFGDESGG